MNTWPLGINAEMDEHAKAYGLEHWSCTNPISNTTWIRQDGEICRPTFKLKGGYLSDLREFDRENPMEKPVFITNFLPGDIIELKGQGYIHWVPEEEAIPNRMLREIRQREVRRVIEFTKRKYS